MNDILTTNKKLPYLINIRDESLTSRVATQIEGKRIPSSFLDDNGFAPGFIIHKSVQGWIHQCFSSISTPHRFSGEKQT